MTLPYIYPCKPNRIELGSYVLEGLNNNPKYVAETKMNGWRCLATKLEDGRVFLFTRHKTLIEDQLPELRAELAEQMPIETMIDGELIEKRTKDTKQLFYAFDCLYAHGIDITYMPLHVRRAALDEIITPTDHIIMPQWIVEDKVSYYHKSIEGEVCEGIVIKGLDSVYVVSAKSCQQNPFWLKLKKPEAHTEVK